jgi:predicted nucleic acid-binding protein
VPGIVVADTGPLRYLVLIGHIDVLPRLFGAVSVPATVADELRHPRAPEAVRAWAAVPPPWFAVHPDPAKPAAELQRLDPGERAAIALAHALGAGLILIDDRAGVAVAREQGFRVTGTLGVLIEAAGQGLLDLTTVFAALRATNFYVPPSLLNALLAQERERRGELDGSGNDV